MSDLICTTCDVNQHQPTCKTCTVGPPCPDRCECVCHCPELNLLQTSDDDKKKIASEEIEALVVQTQKDRDEKYAVTAVEEEAQQLEREERIDKTFKLKQRNLTHREIAKITGVSLSTVSKDLKRAETAKKEIAKSNKTDQIGVEIEIVAGIKDVIDEAWRIAKGSDKETRIKALTQVRLAYNDLRRTYVDFDVIKKNRTAGAGSTIIGIIGWSSKNIQEAVEALLYMKIATTLAEPTLDIIEAEIVEDEPQEEETEEP